MANLEGFSEKGEPESWDMALGTVRGFRWWTLSMNFREMHKDAIWNLVSLLRKWTPDPLRSEVYGMHSGQWGKAVASSGVHKATCTAATYVKRTATARHGTDEVPHPDCGCGFWAYWDSGSYSSWFGPVFPYVRRGRNYGMQLHLPLKGVIEGSGRTIIGEKGFRCQYARITDLAPLTDSGCLLEDEDRNEQLYPYGAHGGHYVSVATGQSLFSGDAWVPNPIQEVGPLLPFIEHVTGVPQQEFREMLQTTLVSILGTGFKYYPSMESLDLCALRDEDLWQVIST